MEWLDRNTTKSTIIRWFSSDNPRFLLSIKDSQEIEDVMRWFDTIKDFRIVNIYLNVESEIMCLGLLESIVNDLGKINFPKFSDVRERLSKTNLSIYVTQNMGSDNKSKSNIEFKENEQKININTSSLLQNYFETRISDFFIGFLEDIKNIKTYSKFLVICKFIGGSYNSIEGNFKVWFKENFLENITKINNIKTFVILEDDVDELKHKFDYNSIITLADFHLDDILPVSKKYLQDDDGLFCRGAVNKDNLISYQDFKLKLLKNLN